MSDTVFYDEQHRNPEARVEFHVPAIFLQLHHGEQDPGVPLPQEHVLHIAEPGSVLEVLHFLVVVGEHQDRDVQLGGAHRPGQLRGVHVAQLQARDDDVEALFPGERQGLGPARDARDVRSLVQVQVEELREDELVELSILRHDERLVETRDEQDVLHPEPHQVLQAPGTPTPGPTEFREHGRLGGRHADSMPMRRVERAGARSTRLPDRRAAGPSERPIRPRPGPASSRLP